MTYYLKQNFLKVVSVAIFLSCAGSDINIKENREVIDQLISQANSYWDQRTDPRALDKAENLIIKVLQQRPTDFENTIFLAKIKFTQAYFLENDPAKQNILFFDGKEMCKKAVMDHPDFASIYINTEGDSSFKLLSSLTDAPRSILPGLYWWGENLAHYLNAKPVMERLNHRELLEVIMHRVIALDPDFHYGGPYRFFGMLYTRIPGLDISQSHSYFDQALNTNPQYLGNSVLMAQFYHQKAGNREQFNEILNRVLNTNLTKNPEVMTDNWFYQKKAQMLLDNESSLFE